MECPAHKLRSDLPPLIERIAKLPIDERGYPVPFFVQWLKDGQPSPPGEGQPDFRIVDPVAMRGCVSCSLCWVCGEKLGVHRAYVIGPMCTVNRISAEPPSHVECAIWSARACPFLTKPHMKRREDEMSKAAIENVAGIMVTRNPGVTVVWVVRNIFRMTNDGKGGILFQIGEPVKVLWFKEGRPATSEECIEALNTSVQSLLDLCDTDDERQEVAFKRDLLAADLGKAENASA